MKNTLNIVWWANTKDILKNYLTLKVCPSYVLEINYFLQEQLFGQQLSTITNIAETTVIQAVLILLLLVAIL